MTMLRTAFLSAAVVISMAGCARQTGAAGDSSLDLEPVELAVANHNWLDVVVFVVHGGQRTRLVTVTAAKSTTAMIPTFALRNDQIRLLAHAVGNPETFLSEPISVRRGMRITWTLESDLNRSSVAVW
jgi:hypothetical protein